jgi:hypothetical protein
MHAVYTADPACAQGWDLSVDGAILHFQSADGAFNESVSGSLFVMHPGTPSPQVAQFWGNPATPFVGTYDIDAAMKKFAHPKVVLEAPMGPGDGYLDVGEQSDVENFIVASWANITPDGAAGSNAGGSTGGGGQSGSGGTTAISNNWGDGGGGAAGAVATAGAGAGGAADSAGSGGSN